MGESIEVQVNNIDLSKEEDGFTVNPWEVTSKDEKGVDYDKLISKLHCSSSRTFAYLNLVDGQLILITFFNLKSRFCFR